MLFFTGFFEKYMKTRNSFSCNGFLVIRVCVDNIPPQSIFYVLFVLDSKQVSVGYINGQVKIKTTRHMDSHAQIDSKNASEWTITIEVESISNLPGCCIQPHTSDVGSITGIEIPMNIYTYIYVILFNNCMQWRLKRGK